MKNLFLLFITYSFYITMSCTNNSNNDGQTETWNLINISGGIAGVNNDFLQGTIIWILNPQNYTLAIENNNTDNNYDGFDSGIYSYNIQNINEKSFMIIEGIEFGGITEQPNELIIDQNITSNGNGADGFILSFER
jgi:hypothetical protein